jgi:glycogen operon protein
MMLMGDEVRRSQGGNNNSWCQDNPLGWMHWQPDQEDQALRSFLQRLLALRRHLQALFNPETPHADGHKARALEPGHLTRHWHGVTLDQPDWASWSHTLAWTLNDPHHGALVWCGLNAYHERIAFQVPEQPQGWLRCIDTALPADADLPWEPEAWQGRERELESRSLVLLVQPALLKGITL